LIVILRVYEMIDKPKIVVDMTLINKKSLESACVHVIDVLKEYDKPTKLAVLHMLLETFPEPYEIIEIK
jgi:hypothetical protein